MKKRVKIPRGNVAQVLTLAKRVRDKHVADGELSLLRTLNWQDLTPLIEDTIALHEKTEILKRDMLVSYEQRAERIARIVNFLRDSRDILAGNHRNEMKMLGKWGYDVMELRSSQAEEQPVMLKQSA